MAKKRKNQNTRSYMIIFGIGIALVIALLILTQRLNPSAPVVSISQDPPEREVLSDDDVPRATQQDAKAVFDSGDAVFIDTRSQESFEAAHIPGALSIELPDIESAVEDLDTGGIYVTY